jgi:histidine ammonia-lyase
VGHAALVLHDCSITLDALNVAAALTYEGFRANLSPLDARVQAARPARGQQAISARLTALLADSALWKRGEARRLQDPVSLRCVTQVHGAALAAMLQARVDVELELNSASENPLVLVESNEILSTGNFHIPGLAIAFEALGIALAHAAMLCVQRCQRMYTPAMSDLPLYLTTRGPEHSGFATVQKTLTALYNQLRHLANPASLDSIPVAQAVEDHAPMTANVVAKTAVMLPLLRLLAAIELLGAAQAVDLRPVAPNAMGRGVAAAYSAVRQKVPMLDHDRAMGFDFDTVAALIADGGIGAVDLLDTSTANGY